MAKRCSQCTKRSFSIDKGLFCGISGKKPDSGYGENCADYEADKAQIEIDKMRCGEEQGGLNQITEADSASDTASSEDNNMPSGSSKIWAAVLVGLFAGIICSVIWAVLSVLTGYQYSIVAIGIGIVVGMAVKKVGKRSSLVLGIIAVLISLLSFVLGDFLCNMSLLAEEESVSYFYALRCFNWRYFFELAFVSIDFMSIAFYLIGAYSAYAMTSKK